MHASDVLGAFQHMGDALRLRDVVDRTGHGKGMCFRLLHTLHHCGFLEKADGGRYRLTSEIRRRRRYRIGYAAQGQDTSFPREVQAGLVKAAERESVDLVIADNRYNPKTAMRNAEFLVREGVHLAIEFQTDEAAAPAIAATYLDAGIPLIAIDIPHPGATYFGADNYTAGLLAGRTLARWARQHWNGQVDEILLVEIARAGSLPHARIKGVTAGIHEVLRDTQACHTVVHRWRRPVQDVARARAPPSAADQGDARARRHGQRPERARRSARVRGGRPIAAPAPSSARTPSRTRGPNSASRAARSSPPSGTSRSATATDSSGWPSTS